MRGPSSFDSTDPQPKPSPAYPPGEGPSNPRPTAIAPGFGLSPLALPSHRNAQAEGRAARTFDVGKAIYDLCVADLKRTAIRNQAAQNHGL